MRSPLLRTLIFSAPIRAEPMAIRHQDKQVSPLRLKLTLLAGTLGPLLLIGLFLQSKGFFG
jgi:hypothetical protein